MAQPVHPLLARVLVSQQNETSALVVKGRLRDSGWCAVRSMTLGRALIRILSGMGFVRQRASVFMAQNADWRMVERARLKIRAAYNHKPRTADALRGYRRRNLSSALLLGLRSRQTPHRIAAEVQFGAQSVASKSRSLGRQFLLSAASGIACAVGWVRPVRRRRVAWHIKHA